MSGLTETDRVSAVSSGRTATFVLGDLHQALLATTTDSVSVARALLHGEGSEQDGRDTELSSVLFEQVDILRTGSEWTLSRVDSAAERNRDDVLDPDKGGSPAA